MKKIFSTSSLFLLIHFAKSQEVLREPVTGLPYRLKLYDYRMIVSKPSTITIHFSGKVENLNRYSFPSRLPVVVEKLTVQVIRN